MSARSLMARNRRSVVYGPGGSVSASIELSLISRPMSTICSSASAGASPENAIR